MFTLVNGSCPLTAVECTNLETACCKDGGKYHCIPNENGQLGQVCTSPMWIQSNFCPEYNTVAKKLDVRLCDFKLGECPFTTYLSNTVYESGTRDGQRQLTCETVHLTFRYFERKYTCRYGAVNEGRCPEYNTIAKKINVVLCNFRNGDCPISLYGSNQAYKYSGCIYKENDISTTRSSTTESTTVAMAIDTSQTTTTTIVVVCVTLLVLLILAGLVIIIVIVKKRRHTGRDEFGGVTDSLLGLEQGNDERGRAQLLKSDDEVRRHKDDVTYYSCPRIIEECWKILSHYGILILTGVPGIGKTRLGLDLLCVSLNHYVKGKPVVGKVLKNLENYESVLSAEATTFLLLDDCLEKWNFLKDDTGVCPEVEILERMLNDHIVSKRDIYVVLTMGSKTWEKFSSRLRENRLLQTCIVYSLESDIIAHTHDEKKQIFLKHAEANDISFITSDDKQTQEEPLDFPSDSAIKGDVIACKRCDEVQDGNSHGSDATLQIRDTVQGDNFRLDDNFIDQIQEKQGNALGFPETCYLFCKVKYFVAKKLKMFEDPVKLLRRRILEWHNSTEAEDKACFSSLAYTLLKGGELDLNNLDEHYVSLVGTTKDRLRNAVSVTMRAYLKKTSNDIFSFQHEIITFVTLDVFGYKYTETFIRYCDPDVLLRYIRTEKFKDEKKTGEFVFCIERKHYESLAERFADMASMGYTIKDHICMGDKSFFEKWKTVTTVQ